MTSLMTEGSLCSEEPIPKEIKLVPACVLHDLGRCRFVK